MDICFLSPMDLVDMLLSEIEQRVFIVPAFYCPNLELCVVFGLSGCIFLVSTADLLFGDCYKGIVRLATYDHRVLLLRCTAVIVYVVDLTVC